MQCKSFSSEFIEKSGFGSDFFPFDNELLEGEVKYICSGQKRLFFIGCRTGVPRHTDGKLNPPYSALLILRNDGLIAKPCRIGKNKLEPQTPGTIILLNIHQYHHCISDSRITPKSHAKLWIALARDYDKKPSLLEVEETFRIALLK